jgi:predicted nucleic acid-binding protein
VKRPKDTTDEHLLALATRHGAKLATLDASIPGAELIS